MARLRTLKPRLQEFKGREVRSLPTPSEKRTTGRKRQEMRLRVWTKAMAFCAGCGRTCDYDSWHMDHVIPLWKGGDDLESNMQVLCIPCHADKTAKEAAERAMVIL
ncbi:5-methylcytosine-specific restriction enzyme A [Pseudomonas delhiensis]|uniref:5-methylcytosine-specific restriction enzyme A n=1 Tax=Pseudomonas delhiensis TaxID=366289 RepID=A0A239NCQ8_9PSED|nr:HNH endonuclease signature motif containing protein [Pseudomonas delhiensis]SDK67682.1 5-methylcytosine-specific restriction enzyme A [Pseudomonas delhiensis]SNT52540.1 5-methylcytosine-specific restriction enzyme A [Pseudomonas delhiensis]